MKQGKGVLNSTKLLIALSEIAETSFDCLDAFIFSAGSVSLLKKDLHMLDEEYDSAFQGLRRHGYIQRINEDQFLICPKARHKILIAKIDNENWEVDWDGQWRIIAFDIPESKKRERNIFRSVIKRKGFVGLQNSVFIAPFADFEALSKLRQDLDIAKYVSFFLSVSPETDDDTALRKRFGLD